MTEKKTWLVKSFLIVIWGLFCWWLGSFLSPDPKPISVPKAEKHLPSDQLNKTGQNPSPQINPEPDSITQDDMKNARTVLEKFLNTFYSSPRQGPQDLAEQVQDFVGEEYLWELRNSQKVDPPKKITELHISPVTPAYIKGGITFHVTIVTEDNFENELWYTLLRDKQGRWRIEQVDYVAK